MPKDCNCNNNLVSPLGCIVDGAEAGALIGGVGYGIANVQKYLQRTNPAMYQFANNTSPLEKQFVLSPAERVLSSLGFPKENAQNLFSGNQAIPKPAGLAGVLKKFQPLINIAGKAPSAKAAIGISAFIGAVAGYEAANGINGLHNGAFSKKSNIAKPILLGGGLGAGGGLYAFTHKEAIEKYIPKQGFFSKSAALLKTPGRSLLAGGATGAKLAVLLYLVKKLLSDKEDAESPKPRR